MLGIDDDIACGPGCMRVRVRVGAEGTAADRLCEIVQWGQGHSPVSDAVRFAVETRFGIDVM